MSPAADQSGEREEQPAAPSEIRPDAALRASQELLPLLIEGASGYALFTMDPEGLIDSWTVGAASVFGWSEEEILGKPFERTFTPRDVATDQPQIELEIAAREGYAPDVRWHVRKDGGRVFINGTTQALLAKDGRLTGFLKIGRDLTAQREAESALRLSEEKYCALFETIDEGFVFGRVFRDAGGRTDFRFEAVNPAFERLTGRSAESLVGGTTREAFANLDEVWYQTFEQVSSTGTPRHLELYTEGLGRWLNAHFSPMGVQGTGTVALAISDISARKEQEADFSLLAEVSQDLVQFSDAEATLSALSGVIGKHLKVSYCAFGEFDEGLAQLAILADWDREGGTFSGTHPLSPPQLEQLLRITRDDMAFVLPDAENDPRIEGTVLTSLRVRSCIAIPVAQEGRRRFLLVTCDVAARQWRDSEVDLAREVTSRIWMRLQRARADDALRRSEEQHRLMVENVRDYALYTLDVEGMVTSWNEGLRRLTGYEESEIVGRHFRVFYPKVDRARDKPEYEMARAAAEGRMEDEGPRVRKDGTPLWVNEIITAMKDGRGNLVGFVKIARDVTERRLAERERLRQERHTALLSERNRMAQELHDTLAQGFTGIRLQIDMAEYALEGTTPDVGLAMQHIVRAREFAQQSQVEARRAIRALRSPLLESHSLAEALEQLVKDVDVYAPVHFITEGTPILLPPLVQDDLFRISQEALTNAIRHSEAELITISVIYGKNEVRLSVADNGKGFDAKPTRKGLGITGMEERAQRIGARLWVESGAQGGTTVCAHLALVGDGTTVLATRDPGEAQ